MKGKQSKICKCPATGVVADCPIKEHRFQANALLSAGLDPSKWAEKYPEAVRSYKIGNSIGQFQPGAWGSPRGAHGECHPACEAYRDHCRALGMNCHIIDVGVPLIDPDDWTIWGSKRLDALESIGHYVVWFPDLRMAVDWTARQFWALAPLPLVMTSDELIARWRDIDWQETVFDEHDIPCRPEQLGD